MELLSVLLSSAIAAEAAALESLTFIAMIGGVFLFGLFFISILGSVKFESYLEENEDIINEKTSLTEVEDAA